MTLSQSQIADFQTAVLSFYHTSGRKFPWRGIEDPYKILVSEMMLQQTQTDRVLSRYSQWLKRFPTATDVAKATLGEVLTEWNGLGYNRRAKFLYESCSAVVAAGSFPSTAVELEQLPGIGPYTARAVSTFAFNNPEVFIETNIRSVFIFTFFSAPCADSELTDGKNVQKISTRVSDKELMPLIAQTLDYTNPRDWYYALMDYGAALKKKVTNPSRSSSHYTKQSKFDGSPRQARGAVIRALTKHNGQNAIVIAESEHIEYERIIAATEKLISEGLIIAAENDADDNQLFFLT